MNIINMDEQLPVRKTGHTSKGDQLKCRVENTWYKADYMGYEGLSEALVSRLLNNSSLPYRFVQYEPAMIEYHGTRRCGCASQNFLGDHQILVPLEKLYRQNTGDSLATSLAAFSDPTDKIRFTVDQVKLFTGLQEFGSYITAMLEIDAFFLNEDRHTNNIAVLYDTEEQKYTLCPLFDHGLCLFADMTHDYPAGKSIDEFFDRIEAKPFSLDFDSQLDAAESLYGIQLHFHFSIKNILKELDTLTAFYTLEVRQRAEEVLRRQIHKYAYLMQPSKTDAKEK